MKTCVLSSVLVPLFLQSIPTLSHAAATTTQQQPPKNCTLFLPAMNYTEMQGVLPLPNIDALGWLDVHDWVLYDMELPARDSASNFSSSTAANANDTLHNHSYYQVEWTVASPTGEGDVLVVHAETRQYFTHLYGMPVTGDWDVFQTITSNIPIPLPSNQVIPFKIQILKSGFNLQSLCIRAMPDRDEDDTAVPSPAPSIMDAFGPDDTPVFLNPTDSCDAMYQAARDYSQMQGMTVQGKQVSNLAWMDHNDFVAYDITLPKKGWYQLHFGVSSPSGDGAFRVETTTKEPPIILLTISQLPVTGNWYTYETVSSELIYLSQGSQRLTLIVEEDGWNFRWWCWDLVQVDEEEDYDTTGTTPTSTPTSFADGSAATGFVHADGATIRDPQGNPLFLRGVALGGWMAPHLVTSPWTASAREWWNQVDTTLGTAKRRTFQQSWLDLFVTRDDLQQVKATGFNAIRVPLHYELFTLPIHEESMSGYDTWLGMGFRLLDQLMEWATEQELFVLLDLQAAPGGQGLDPVTDYDSSHPSLWEQAENRRKTVALWQELARRYANHPWVAGYDLLSAVDWNFQENEWATRHWNGCDETSNGPLRAFYEQTIAAIRKVDEHHMIVLAGNCWGTNHKGLLPINDTNAALGVHSYGGKPIAETLDPLIAVRDKYNVPFVMTHVGGNLDESPTKKMTQTLESNGWFWWTWKSMNTTSSPFQFGSSTSYNTLVEYWNNDCTEIHVESAFDALMQVANNTQMSKTKPIASVIETLLGYVN